MSSEVNDFTFGLKKGDLKIIIDVLKKYPEIEIAKIFGSRAMGNYKNGSDVDIVLFGENLELILHKVSGCLNSESPLPYKFDVIYYNTNNQNLRDHIDQFGVVFYQR